MKSFLEVIMIYWMWMVTYFRRSFIKLNHIDDYAYLDIKACIP